MGVALPAVGHVQFLLRFPRPGGSDSRLTWEVGSANLANFLSIREAPGRDRGCREVLTRGSCLLGFAVCGPRVRGLGGILDSSVLSSLSAGRNSRGTRRYRRVWAGIHFVSARGAATGIGRLLSQIRRVRSDSATGFPPSPGTGAGPRFRKIPAKKRQSLVANGGNRALFAGKTTSRPRFRDDRKPHEFP